jgi:transposase InsO family protein
MPGKPTSSKLLLLPIIWPNGSYVAVDKVQNQSPSSNLGQLIEGWTIHPQKIEIHKYNLKTLNDFQKLLGDINRLYHALKLTTCELPPFFKILQGDTQPSSPRYLTPEGHMALSKVEEAFQIVKSCSKYAPHLPVPTEGVNAHGLHPLSLWQMDVTHIPSFGLQHYVHVVIDTYSGFVFASPRSRERTRHVIDNCLATFAVMGKPLYIKTNNGPGYPSATLKEFCS